MRRFQNLLVGAVVALGATVALADPLELQAPLPKVSPHYLQAEAASGASEEELAKKLSNPISSLISVPYQSNVDQNTGAGNDGWRYTLNVQPVFLWPTGTNDSLGSEKWGAGPSIVVLKQEGPWTYGILANHIWSYAGDSDRRSVNSTFLQPFLAYNTKSGFGVTVQTESTYDWNESQWTIPIGLFASQVLKVGGQPISVNFGPRYYVEGPDGAPEWGLRFTLTFLFPK
jgi:hypothetical protein